jgi:2C-methyl-D-erythritol 2,4-cyclodiphosphate synthase
MKVKKDLKATEREIESFQRCTDLEVTICAMAERLASVRRQLFEEIAKRLNVDMEKTQIHVNNKTGLIVLVQKATDQKK